MCHMLLVLFALVVVPMWLSKIWADVSPGYSGGRTAISMSTYASSIIIGIVVLFFVGLVVFGLTQ